MEGFGSATREWFAASFEAPTPIQTQGWPQISAGHHSLLIAPTGSGKTLAAFLWALDRLSHQPTPDRAGVRVLYISPLKALAYDIERNLRAPLVGISNAAAAAGRQIHRPTVSVRTGDTPQKDRRRFSKSPSDILVTTPESLYLILCSSARETLRTVETVIVDEIHALAPTKRGAHLSLSLEHLSHICHADPQRLGLSATVQPPHEVARFLGGDRRVEVVDTSASPRLDIEIVVPVADMTNPAAGAGRAVEPVSDESSEGSIGQDASDDDTGAAAAAAAVSEHEAYTAALLAELADRDDAEKRSSIWPAIYPQLLALIRAHQSTIIFVNSRGLCERLAQRLNEQAGDDLVLAHHGSVSHQKRKQIEEALKAGQVPGIVATSSLELGIDMGAVDLVILVESPASVASGLQRIGRAGHDVGEVSRGRLFPKHRGDLLEAAVVVKRMTQGAIEPIDLPRNPLDVLAQQIVAMCVMDDWPVDAVERVVRRSANFHELTQELLYGVLDMLSGRYPSTDFADLRPRLHWDRERHLLEARRGAPMVARLSGGTIADRGQYGVFMGPEGPRVGELDEEMVFESRVGETIILGASSWRVEQITRDRVIVSPAPGEPGRLPFWHGTGPGRPIELGRAIGRFTRELAAKDTEAAEQWLRAEYHLDPLAIQNLVDYIGEQRDATGTVPSDRTIIIERFRDELGDWRVCILTPFGARVHAPWAMAIEAKFSRDSGFEVQTLYTDDGIALRMADGESPPDAEVLLPDPDELEDLIVEQLGHSPLFTAQFRENAGRALLLTRRKPGSRTPLWAQRLKSQQLLGVARGFPAFPIVLETYRSCLQDIFDVPALIGLLHDIQSRQVTVREAETHSASPFSRSLVLAWIGGYMYQYASSGDIPLAERRVHALALDRQMLRELLGHEELRELLDADVLEQLERELQHLAPNRRVRHADGLHDLLRRLGDLSTNEVQARSLRTAGQAKDAPSGAKAHQADVWLADLKRAKRVVEVRIGGEARWIAVEDAALYRDALGVALPTGLPDVFLEPVSDALQVVLVRWARTHGPFVTRAILDRYRLAPGAVDAVLRLLVADDALLRGDFRPGGVDTEWCDPEILRRLKRRTLARLRSEIAPVEREALGRFLPAWHGLDDPRRGLARLEEVVDQLEGVPLSFRDLEQLILPLRVSDYRPHLLDELCSSGELVWVGHGSLGTKDGRIGLYRRDRIRLWLDPPDTSSTTEPLSDLHAKLLSHLSRRGACFFPELVLANAPIAEVDVVDALWDLVWAGQVTNDTLRPLRTLGMTKRATSRRRGMGPNPLSRAGGRWSLVSELLDNVWMATPGPTEQAHARAVALLERHGVVAREAMELESIPGGFSAVYQVLRAMEDAGRVRRGYFVDGLGGAQFAYAGAIERLRSARAKPEHPRVRLMAATDPANPWGWLLPWPGTKPEKGAIPRRAAGAIVVLVAGEPVVYLDRGRRRLTTFPIAAVGQNMLLAARALRRVAELQRGRALRLDQINGDPARQSEHLSVFKRASFFADHRGLTLEA